MELLGPPAIQVGATRFSLPNTRPAWLLAYLGATGTWTDRAHLAYLFRPDAPESTARHYVRNLLLRAVRLNAEAIGDLEVESTRCRWTVPTDVDRFRRAIRRSDWHEALETYRGPFVDGRQPDVSPVLDTWVDLTRKELSNAWRLATVEYAKNQESSGRHDDAAGALYAFLQDEILDEAVLQSYVRNAYLAGRRQHALSMAERFMEHATVELDVAPMSTTVDLIEKVRHGETVEAEKPGPSVRRRWTDTVTDADGSDELQQLIALLADPANRLLTVTDSPRNEHEAVIVARKVSRPGLTLFAIVDLAENLASEGHYRRAVELLVLVMTASAHHGRRLRERVERAWELLEDHVPSDLIQQAKSKW